MKKQLYLNLRQIFFRLLGNLDFLMSKNNYILCYHSFSQTGNSYSVSPNNFRKHIKTLLKKYTFVSLDDIFTTTRKNCIALTVDDGYEDVLSILPFLEKHQIPLTLFVLGNPKKANRIELDHPGKLLTFSQLKTLQKKGVIIGSHSMTHANLGLVSTRQLRDEILGSKKTLEQKLNTKIHYFAFPKGIYTSEALALVKKAKYKAAFTVVSGAVGEYSLLTPRTIIDQYYSAHEILSSLNPIVESVKKTMSRINFWKLMPSI